MSDRTIILISGSNTGLGFETAKSLLASSSSRYTIIVCSRSLDRAKEAARELSKGDEHLAVPLQLDLQSDDSIAAAQAFIEARFGKLDVLINNAGINNEGFTAPTDVASRRVRYAQTWDINFSGTHLLTEALMPLLFRSNDARVLFIGSSMGSLQEMKDGKPLQQQPIVPASGWPKESLGMNMPAYRGSKAAITMLMLEWARVLKGDKVKVWAVCPGWLATALGEADPEQMRSFGALDPKTGADFLRDVVEGKRDKDEGQFVNLQGFLPW